MWRVRCKTEWHDVELVCSVACNKGGFVTVVGVNWDLVVARKEVKFGEDGGVCETVV